MNINRFEQTDCKLGTTPLRINRLLIFGLMILIACNNQNPADKMPIPTISLDSASKVYMNVVVAKPLFVASFKDTLNQNIIVGFKETEFPKSLMITKIKSVNNNWQVDFEKRLSDYCSYLKDTLNIETIESKKYIYFVSTEGCGGSGEPGGNVAFHLIDPTDLHDYFIILYGEYVNDDQISGNFQYDSLLIKREPLKRFLEAKTQASKYVYKKTAADFDINNPKNFEKKFLIDNPDIQENKNRNGDKLNVTYYDEDLTKIVGSSVDTIENKDYKVFVLFRFGVVGYDKTKKKYFPIYIDKCNHGCDLQASFDRDNILNVNYDFGDRLQFDLDKFNYSRESSR